MQSAPWKSILLMLLALPALVAAVTQGPRWATAAVVACCGLDGTATVTDRQEWVELGNETWKRHFQVSFRYRPLNEAREETATQSVTTEQFDRLEPGGSAHVRYARQPSMRRAEGGAVLESSAFPTAGEAARGEFSDLLVTVMMFASGTLFVLNFFGDRRMRILGAIGFLSALVGVYVMGWLVIAPLLVAWRKRPGAGFGHVLAGSVVLGVALMTWRLPWPASLPDGAKLQADARVVQVATVDRVWASLNGAGSSSIRGGISFKRQPGIEIAPAFKVVDVELPRPTGRGTVHAVDEVDVDAANSLLPGATVKVWVPRSDPRAAYLVNATRNHAFAILAHLLWWTTWTSLLALPLAWPVVLIGVRVADWWRAAPSTPEQRSP